FRHAAHNSSLFYYPTRRSSDLIGVIERDEAALTEILRRVRPKTVVLNNLFRDQLDRYGELNAIATMWKPALRELPSSATVVVNADRKSTRLNSSHVKSSYAVFC